MQDASDGHRQHASALQVGIRPLLLGVPLSARGNGSEAPNGLNVHIESLRTLVRNLYGETQSARVRSELQSIIDIPCATSHGAMCKRALILYALRNEQEVSAYFATQEKAVNAHPLARILAHHVLPLLVPAFIARSFENPDEFVHDATSMALMFGGDIADAVVDDDSDNGDAGGSDGEGDKEACMVKRARTRMPPPPARASEQIAKAELPPPDGSIAM
jgi:hypothetical protein